MTGRILHTPGEGNSQTAFAGGKIDCKTLEGRDQFLSDIDKG
jgi:hypothetical protein